MRLYGYFALDVMSHCAELCNWDMRTACCPLTEHSTCDPGFMQVRLDYADLGERLDWALTHDAEAHVIAQQAAVIARLHLRIEDVECYW